MSKGTYSHSNRHRMHENLVPNLGTKMGTKIDAEIEKMFADAKPLTEADLKAFGEKNREIMESWTRMHEPQVTNYDEVARLKGVITELKKENTELKRTLSDIMYTLSTIMDYQQPTK